MTSPIPSITSDPFEFVLTIFGLGVVASFPRIIRLVNYVLETRARVEVERLKRKFALDQAMLRHGYFPVPGDPQTTSEPGDNNSSMDTTLEEGDNKASRHVTPEKETGPSGKAKDQSAIDGTPSANHRLSILLEIYGQALAQARWSASVALVFSGLGALILLIGIGAAIWRASSDGNQIAAVVSTVAGIVTNVTASLFFIQNNQARKHLERQANDLRIDVLADERVNTSLAIISDVRDDKKKDDLRTELIHHLIVQNQLHMSPNSGSRASLAVKSQHRSGKKKKVARSRAANPRQPDPASERATNSSNDMDDRRP